MLQGRYVQIRYETLVGDVGKTIGAIIKFCQLAESEPYLRLLPKSLPNMNHKWQKELSADQKLVLEQVIGKFLTKLGYY